MACKVCCLLDFAHEGHVLRVVHIVHSTSYNSIFFAWYTV